MPDFRFTQEFLKQLTRLAPLADDERDELDAALGPAASVISMVRSPMGRCWLASPTGCWEKSSLPERFPSHYDPNDPSYFVRCDPSMIHYSIESETGIVVFRTLFRRQN